MDTAASNFLGALLAVSILLGAGCAAKDQRPLAYVSNERDGTISVIDVQTDQVIRVFQVGARPRGIRLSPDGKRVYVAVSTPMVNPTITPRTGSSHWMRVAERYWRRTISARIRSSLP